MQEVLYHWSYKVYVFLYPCCTILDMVLISVPMQYTYAQFQTQSSQIDVHVEFKLISDLIALYGLAGIS